MSDLDIDDDLDDLFSYDIDEIGTTYDPGGDAQEATDQASSNTTKAATTGKGKEKDEGDLGVDEEVKIRKRKPVVKLTEDRFVFIFAKARFRSVLRTQDGGPEDADDTVHSSRLIGPDGIPYLQQHAAKKLKFKGKGHEIADLGRLLNFYQIWADNMYPKANFKDVLEIIEKLGSSRGMQRQREEWIEEFKMKQLEEDDRLVGRAREVLAKDEPTTDHLGRKIIRVADPSRGKPESEATKAADANREQANADAGDSLFFHDDDDDLDEDLDELDAIMREAENPKATGSKAADQPDHDEMDELDAIMREMEENPAPKEKPQVTGLQALKIDDSEDEFEEAMAAIREGNN
ncbi:Chromosome segregation in meiosis protein [Drechslerella dactyloides]|uniref:Chromosome segregation in meiosis protein n=1 Tax=Drechslerella dactyloides TaxID=74499 RepID=A0AAD6J408_DREDA|nr:Chromosome segregation in meiosis protein [Drechslerella dactyloides]